MTSTLDYKLDAILARQDELHALLQTAEASSYVALAKELAEIEPIVARVRTLRAAAAELVSIEQLLADPATDAEMRELAQEERMALKERVPALERELRLALLPKDAADDKSAILEIRAGTGGEEAALFAGDLFRMYQRYAELKGWKVDVMSESETDLGGYKEIVLAIEGKGVFARLKFEAGVHRVQRVPTTESSGRIHTSAATVAVLPEADEVDIVIDDKDLKFDVFRASGAGGQHVNRTESAVRVTHIPTGIAFAVQEQRSQHKNKARALAMLRAKLYELEREAKDSSRAADRKGQVGSGDRSERIRTYNFPQNRVTDHRINLTLYSLDRLMAAGTLDEIIEPLTADHEAARLAEAEG